MHEAFLKHIKPKPPPELASTTFIHRIFGGKLRSEVSTTTIGQTIAQSVCGSARPPARHIISTHSTQ
jgi:hypothetical protein